MAVKGSVAIPPLRDEFSKYEPYCSSAGPNGAWTSKDWGIAKIVQEDMKASLPFKISVKGQVNAKTTVTAHLQLHPKTQMAS